MAVFVLWTLFNDWKNQTLFEKNKNVESFVLNYKLLLHIIGKLFEKKNFFESNMILFEKSNCYGQLIDFYAGWTKN